MKELTLLAGKNQVVLLSAYQRWLRQQEHYMLQDPLAIPRAAPDAILDLGRTGMEALLEGLDVSVNNNQPC
ncbi:MAG: hypothetical protein ACREVE_06615 [Gammaproteobacteria bacterium]